MRRKGGEPDIRTPSGMEMTTAPSVAVSISAMVLSESSQRSRTPRNKRAASTSSGRPSLRVAAKASPTSTAITTHHGVAKRPRSIMLSVHCSGEAAASNPAPQLAITQSRPSSMARRSGAVSKTSGNILPSKQSGRAPMAPRRTVNTVPAA